MKDTRRFTLPTNDTFYLRDEEAQAIIDGGGGGTGGVKILWGTVASWSANDFVTAINTIYVYKDAIKDDYGNVIPAIKFGDGTTLLSQVPFIASQTTSQGEPVTPEEKTFWNQKVSVAYDPSNPEHIYFITN